VFLDIETAPSLGWVWGKWEQNVIDFKEDGYVLSFSIKKSWERGVKTRGLPDYPIWEKNKKDDSDILKDLWEEMNEADIIVAHNGDRFDIPTINTRFVTLGLQPPKPSKTVDTLKIARNKFKFKSNKLDDLGRDLGIGRKMPHTGIHLWLMCMTGDLKFWRIMKRYNRRDVLLLEQLYYKFLPWASNHPNVNSGNEGQCIRCGSTKIKPNGQTFTVFRKKDRIHCLNCKAWFEGAAKKI
jgi:hypothetical protein